METPKLGDYTLVVPLNREKTKKATFYLRDIDETVFLATKAVLAKGKELDAVMVMIKALRVGGDEVRLLENNFIAKQSASFLLGEFLEPVEGELKKN